MAVSGLACQYAGTVGVLYKASAYPAPAIKGPDISFPPQVSEQHFLRWATAAVPANSRRCAEAAELEALPNALDFNESQWPGHAPWRPLCIFIRDAETIVAGSSGETYCGWLVIKYLWVRHDLRRRGVGRELMAQAEARAVERGCHAAWLDTFSFQARSFYEKLGCGEFGTLDYPPLHKRHFMRKLLVRHNN